ISKAAKRSTGGKRLIEPPTHRDKRRLGSRYLNVPSPPRSCIRGFGKNYCRTFWRAAFVERHLSKLFSRCLDAGGPGEMPVVPRLCHFERCAFRRQPLFAVHPCAFHYASIGNPVR